MSKMLASFFHNERLYEQFKINVKHKINLYKANEKIIEEGKTYPYFYFINHGKVKIVLSEGPSAQKIQKLKPIITTLGENQIFGEFRLFDTQIPTSADAFAVVDSEIILIDIQSFVKFLDNDPELGYKIVSEMMGKLIHELHESNQIVLKLLRSGVELQKGGT